MADSAARRSAVLRRNGVRLRRRGGDLRRRGRSGGGLRDRHGRDADRVHRTRRPGGGDRRVDDRGRPAALPAAGDPAVGASRVGARRGLGGQHRTGGYRPLPVGQPAARPGGAGGERGLLGYPGAGGQAGLHLHPRRQQPGAEHGLGCGRRHQSSSATDRFARHRRRRDGRGELGGLARHRTARRQPVHRRRVGPAGDEPRGRPGGHRARRPAWIRPAGQHARRRSLRRRIQPRCAVRLRRRRGHRDARRCRLAHGLGRSTRKRRCPSIVRAAVQRPGHLAPRSGGRLRGRDEAAGHRRTPARHQLGRNRHAVRRFRSRAGRRIQAVQHRLPGL